MKFYNLRKSFSYKKFIFFILLLFCQFYCLASAKDNISKNKSINYFEFTRRSINIWNKFIKKASTKYHIDEKLIKAIIYVESGGNFHAKSNSNAIGLMQIKASSAGKEVFLALGKKGKPSNKELFNPQKNINIGTKYIQILQKQNLFGIQNLKKLRYATIVAYCNGSHAFLKIFSTNKKKAIFKINNMNLKQLITKIKNKHPSKQAFRYLGKVLKIYSLL